MKFGRIIFGILAAMGVGTILGILFAPDKGSNTRRKIADKSGDIKDSVKNSYNDFVDGVKQTYAGAKEEAEDFANKAKAKLDGVKHEVKNAMS